MPGLVNVPVNPVLFIEAISLQVVASSCSTWSGGYSHCSLSMNTVRALGIKMGQFIPKRHPTMPVHPQEANATMLSVYA